MSETQTRSWTDDDGVTHAASSLLTDCTQVVASKHGPAKFDEPSRPVTCVFCTAGIAVANTAHEAISHLMKNGFTIDYTTIEAVVKRVHGPKERRR